MSSDGAGTRLLTIQHQSDGPPGKVGDWLRECGVRLDVVRPDRGMPLPASVRGFAGLLVLGGAMGAYDHGVAPWLAPVEELIREAVAARLPTLGICLGHQLLAVACGGRVERHPVGRRMGVVDLDLTAEAPLDPLFAELGRPASAPRWHQDIVVAPPPEAVVLATAQEGPGSPEVIHAMRVGDCAWGVQVHPEAQPATVRRWADRTEQAMQTGQPGAGVGELWPVRRAYEEIRRADGVTTRTWRPVVQAFASSMSCR